MTVFGIIIEAIIVVATGAKIMMGIMAQEVDSVMITVVVDEVHVLIFKRGDAEEVTIADFLMKTALLAMVDTTVEDQINTGTPEAPIITT